MYDKFIRVCDLDLFGMGIFFRLDFDPEPSPAVSYCCLWLTLSFLLKW
jgi:hypothetical protein